MIWLLLQAARACGYRKHECTDCGEWREEGCGGEDCNFDVEQRMRRERESLAAIDKRHSGNSKS